MPINTDTSDLIQAHADFDVCLCAVSPEICDKCLAQEIIDHNRGACHDG